MNRHSLCFALLASACSGRTAPTTHTQSTDASTSATPPAASVPPGHAAAQKSGARLRARYIAGADGSRQFVGWWDSERKEECAFAKAEDGTLRCLPTSYPTTYFADASCTKRVLFVDEKVCTPKYAALATPIASDCGQLYGSRIFRVGEVVPKPEALYTESASGCTPMPIGTGYKVHALTIVPPAAFVGASEETD